MLSQGNISSGYRILILLLLISGGAALLISSVSADTAGSISGKPVVIILAQGPQSHYLGEKVSLTGQNTGSDSTYLFITGPNIPSGGGKLTSPQHAVVSGSPESFTIVKTKPDKTWEYPFYTANLPYDAGSYTLYAVSTPVAENQFDNSTTYGTVSIILKKPFISAEISPDPVVKGTAFAVTGFVEGNPPAVQVWIIGNNYAFTTKAPVNQDASFTFNADAAMAGNLPAGQNYLIVQHPMMDNLFSIGLGGDYVRSLNPGNGTILFRITGAGSLQGGDVADALTVALTEGETGDKTYTNDTFTIVPFQVTESGSTIPSATAVPTAPASSPTSHHSPLQYAPIGALALVAGIMVWRRQQGR